MSKLKFVDLFAGCGGMSLGLEWAGFEPLVAIEQSEMAAETYFHNFHRSGDPGPEAWRKHVDEDCLGQAMGGVVVAGVEKVLKDEATMQWLEEQQVDVLVGGPPCQGFSMAGRRNSDDHRNQLPQHFIKYIKRLCPRAVVVENVQGINRRFTASAGQETTTDFEELCRRIAKIKIEVPGKGNVRYVVQPLELNAAHYGVPQHRPRMFIVALRADELSSRTDGSHVNPTMKLWRSRDVWNPKDDPTTRPDIPLLAPAPINATPVSTWAALCDLQDDRTYGIPGKRAGKGDYEKKASHYAWAMRNNENRWQREPDSHEYRKHNDDTKARFRLYRTLSEKDISSAVFGIAAKEEEGGERTKAVKRFLREKRPGRLTDKEIDELAKKIEELPTRKHSQQVLKNNQPSPTVLTVPDDLVHPFQDRVMTVRELARLQSFPDWFQFRGKMTTGGQQRKAEVPRYTQVGNAVPPLLARAIGKTLRELLS